MRGVPSPSLRPFPGDAASGVLDGLVIADGRGTGQMWRALHAAGHRGRRARQLGAPQGFRPKGATKAAAPPTVHCPALTSAAYGGQPWPLISPTVGRVHFSCPTSRPSGPARRRCALEIVEKGIPAGRYSSMSSVGRCATVVRQLICDTSSANTA